ncbi:bifunctional 4-hydroxy-2-oxoglutarate aldolase/2-dehydro-3-deoxy-phosphogluconate aldolase [Terasakiella sp. SH-1]|uniref:bifunctional 4-hydroxy-2-oxoglutarate aldolase/2-dehydro-3-deoxy-phosphogluconate aldolase n=1 Tax=Terasakiella sp. SH-1 TaxID=2560057 RepID=UPI001073CD7B|nr:bifunctional 4-hydroxy-2-oxoglutarate aldolase/2-dehydro-3-deoxy-phosphogluconate aldolase [Terasakiella sp. SH-1]
MKTRVSSVTGLSKIIPVLVIEDVAHAVPLARCLVQNGLPVLEITLRSSAALESIQAIMNEVEGAVIGVGSVLAPEQLEQIEKMGVAFGVSPGVSPNLFKALKDSDLPFLAGGSTLSEVLTLREAGFMEQKAFPASVAGGIDYLKAVSGPVGDVSFCPTGGVKPANVLDYLALDNVFAVGGTWIAPGDLVNKQDWDEIGRRAASASALVNKDKL